MSVWLIAFCSTLLFMLVLALIALYEISSQIARLQRNLEQISKDNSIRSGVQTDIAIRIESELKWIRQTLIP